MGCPKLAMPLLPLLAFTLPILTCMGCPDIGMVLHKVGTCIRHVGVPVNQRRLVQAKGSCLLPVVTPPTKREPGSSGNCNIAPRRHTAVDLVPTIVLPLRPTS